MLFVSSLRSILFYACRWTKKYMDIEAQLLHRCFMKKKKKKRHVEQTDMQQIINVSAYLSRTHYGLARVAPDIDVSALRQQYACMICWVGLSVRMGLINNNWPFLLIQDLTRAFGWTWRGSNDWIRLNSYDSYGASSVGTSARQHGTPERNAQGARFQTRHD